MTNRAEISNFREIKLQEINLTLHIHFHSIAISSNTHKFCLTGIWEINVFSIPTVSCLKTEVILGLSNWFRLNSVYKPITHFSHWELYLLSVSVRFLPVSKLWFIVFITFLFGGEKNKPKKTHHNDPVQLPKQVCGIGHLSRKPPGVWHPNVLSKPSLVQLRTNPMCAVAGCQGEELNSSLSTCPPQEVLQSNEIAPQPPFLLDKPRALSCSSQDIPSSSYMCFVTLWMHSMTLTFSVPELPTVLKGRLHQPWRSQKCMNIAVWVISTFYSSLFITTWSQYQFVPSSGQIDVCGSCTGKYLCIW